jgi:hypothetical protein
MDLPVSWQITKWENNSKNTSLINPANASLINPANNSNDLCPDRTPGPCLGSMLP